MANPNPNSKSFKPGQKISIAGRPPGTQNKVTRELRAAAREHSPASLETLVRLMHGECWQRVEVGEEPKRKKDGTPILDANGDPEMKPKYKQVIVPVLPADRIKAASEILDRAHGKSRQAVDVTHQPADLSLLSDEQLEQLRRIRAALDGRDPDMGQPGDGATPPALPAPEGGTGPVH